PEFSISSVTDVHHPSVRTISMGCAQLDLGLDFGSDIDLGDQAKGQWGWVVRRSAITGERELAKLVWGLLPRGTKTPLRRPARSTHGQRQSPIIPCLPARSGNAGQSSRPMFTISAAQREVRDSHLQFLARMAGRWRLPDSGSSSNGRTAGPPGAIAS